jgi:methyl-accepting chemotaxis protein
VRALARRCSEAAKETAGKVSAAMSNSTQGVALSAKVAQAVSDIDEKGRRVDQLVPEVADAPRGQNQGITQISVAVTQMDKATQGSAANIQGCKDQARITSIRCARFVPEE